MKIKYGAVLISEEISFNLKTTRLLNYCNLQDFLQKLKFITWKTSK